VRVRGKGVAAKMDGDKSAVYLLSNGKVEYFIFTKDEGVHTATYDTELKVKVISEGEILRNGNVYWMVIPEGNKVFKITNINTNNWEGVFFNVNWDSQTRIECTEKACNVFQGADPKPVQELK